MKKLFKKYNRKIRKALGFKRTYKKIVRKDVLQDLEGLQTEQKELITTIVLGLRKSELANLVFDTKNLWLER